MGERVYACIDRVDASTQATLELVNAVYPQRFMDKWIQPIGVRFTRTNDGAFTFARSRLSYAIAVLNKRVDVHLTHEKVVRLECTHECLNSKVASEEECVCRCGGIFHGLEKIPPWAMENLAQVTDANGHFRPRSVAFRVRINRGALTEVSSVSEHIREWQRQASLDQLHTTI